MDPPPPIESSGTSVISSLEFYEASRARLNAGGVMMQWIPYGATVDEFKAHVRTFARVFRHVILARGPGGNGFFMFGSDAPIRFDQQSIGAVLARPGVLADLSSAPDSPRITSTEWAAALPDLVLVADDQLRAFAGTGPLVTDDRPLPEYFVLRRRFNPSPWLTPDALSALVTMPQPPV